MKIPGSVMGSGSQEYWSYLSKGGIRHGALPMMNLTTTLCKFQNNKIQRVDNNKLDDGFNPYLHKFNDQTNILRTLYISD